MTRRAAWAAWLLTWTACAAEPAEPVDSTPPGEEIAVERAPVPAAPAVDVCFHDPAVLLACEAAERPEDVAAALQELRDQLEAASARPPAIEGPGPVAVPAPGDLPADVAALDPIARGLACHAEGQSAAWALYWMARTRYDAHRLAQAASLFDAVIARAPDSELAGFSASLALDALLRRARQRPELEGSCHDRIADRVLAYRGALCESEPIPEDTCAMLVRLDCQLARRKGEDLARAGDMAAASVAYEAMADGNCDAGDEALYNAAVTAERAGDSERARHLREELARRFPTSPLVGR